MKQLFILAVALLLSACSTINSWMPWYSDVKLKSIQFISDTGVHSNRAITFDLVFLTEEALAKQFEKITPVEWFSQKKDYLTGYPVEITLSSWEMVPGFPATLREMPDASDDALIAVLFANYPEPNYSKVILTKITHARIILGNDGMTLVELDKELSEVEDGINL